MARPPERTRATCRAVSVRGKVRVRSKAPSPGPGRPAVIETPSTAGDIMTGDVVSVSVGTSVRDVAMLMLEKRISAMPVLAADLRLAGMVSEGDLIGRSDADRVARRRLVAEAADGCSAAD